MRVKTKLLTQAVVLSLICVPLISNAAETTVNGVVFNDTNLDGMHDVNELGINDVLVSNGKDVTTTDKRGRYTLPAFNNMTVFVTKPAGYNVPVTDLYVPQFYYIHQPAGSPDASWDYQGLVPSGNLPTQIDFPLYKGSFKQEFKAVVVGDTQPYTNLELSYMRDSLVNDIAQEEAEFVIVEGDIVGDDLGLYPRFKSLMSAAKKPVYVVPGNHDLNFFAEDDRYSLDTFKRELGPTYYSFDIGHVHFIVLDDLEYPCKDRDGSRSFCEAGKTYNGIIDDMQMEWLKNDLSYTPMNKLIVLNMHVPIVSFVDQYSKKHSVDNRKELYAILDGRKVVALSGHTHTLEHFETNEELPGWGQATPFPQIVTGAASGSWWSGDLMDDNVPMAYQRLGAPRGYLVFEFKGNEYEERFHATNKSSDAQMSLSFLSPTFQAWYDELLAWVKAGSKGTPPTNINQLPDTGIITTAELPNTFLISNFWNGSTSAKIRVKFDDRDELMMTRDTNTLDPYALRLQMSVTRFANGFQLFRSAQYGKSDPQPLPEFFLTKASSHIWKLAMPPDLGVGVHQVKLEAQDQYGNEHKEVLTFEVLPVRPIGRYDGVIN